jgi:hypothetical protein
MVRSLQESIVLVMHWVFRVTKPRVYDLSFQQASDMHLPCTKMGAKPALTVEDSMHNIK